MMSVSFYDTWQDIKNVDFAILPIGSVEQHGKHLPLFTDGIIATAITNGLADVFSNSYVLPALPFSSSYEHLGFPGSVSLKTATLSFVVKDILESLELNGISKCVIITGHMGNHLLRNIVQELNVNNPRALLLPNAKHWQLAYRDAGLNSNPSSDMHAGEGETSILLSLNKEYVNLNELTNVEQPSRQLLEVLGMRSYTNTGTIGFPSYASVDKGKKLLRSLNAVLVPIVKEFLNVQKK